MIRMIPGALILIIIISLPVTVPYIAMFFGVK